MKNYPLYETTVFENFRVLVENVATRFPDRAALVYRKHPKDETPTEVTFRELRDRVRDVGTALTDLGCRDVKIAVIGEASCDWITAYFALGAVNAVSVPIDAALPAPDMASILNTAEVTYVFYSPSVEAKITELRDDVPSVKTYYCMMGEPTMPEALPFADLMARGAELVAAGDTRYYDYEIDAERLASIVFTSGTTGKGKGVMLSQRNIVSDMTQGMYNFAITMKTVHVLPPHHTFGSTVVFVGHLSQGCTVYLSSGLRYILQELKEQQPTHLVLVPLFVETFYKRIWSTAEKQGKAKLLKRMMKFSNGLRKIGIDVRRKMFASVLEAFGGKLEMIICGGAALNQDIIDTFEAIGVTVLNGYGITECAPLISCNRNKLQKPRSVGTPIIGEQVKILDPDENGEGEICVKGPNVMLGYYKNEAATREVFDAEGYFRTGDLGKLDEDGWVYITGRAKNLIIFSNGKNVYPEEIETEISRIPGVAETVVYAGESKSHPREVIVAEIYPEADVLAARGITDPQRYFEEEMKKVNARMVSYKAVGYVKLRDIEFKKNTSKKIIRYAIDKTIE